jgi:hypothetical protein
MTSASVLSSYESERKCNGVYCTYVRQFRSDARVKFTENVIAVPELEVPSQVEGAETNNIKTTP